MSNEESQNTQISLFQRVKRLFRVRAQEPSEPPMEKEVVIENTPKESDTEISPNNSEGSSTVLCASILGVTIILVSFLNYIILRLEESRKEEQRITFNDLYHSHASIRNERTKRSQLQKQIEGLRVRFSQRSKELHQLQVEQCKFSLKEKRRAKQLAQTTAFFTKFHANIPRKIAKCEYLVSKATRQNKRLKRNLIILKTVGILTPIALLFGMREPIFESA